MQFELSSQSLGKISSDVTLVFAFTEDSKKKKSSFIPLTTFRQLDAFFDKQLTTVAKGEDFTGNRGETVVVIPQKKSTQAKIMLVGLGEKKSCTLDDIRQTFGKIAKQLRTRADSLSFALPTKEESGFERDDLLHAFVEGLSLGKYVFLKYKKAEEHERTLSTVIIAEQKENAKVKAIIDKAKDFVRATIVARDLINEPPTVATPTYLASLAQDIAKGNPQVTCTIYDKKECEKMGMGAFLGIARGAVTPPKFIHLEYTPKKKSKEKIALVGKGITFDSGGINVKPGDYMGDMKSDMSGAAAVLGIFSVITKFQPDKAVMGLIAATPNMISGESIVPDEVVRAMNGKTIEIINTDAEGRVTLADSLSYAVKKGATNIIDLATLTGACMVSLGNDIAGLFSNNDALTSAIKKAAASEGEKVWELPLEKEYKALNKSEVADVSNLGSSRYGGAITAALFLEEFVDNKPWVHLDIAGPAFSKKGTNLGPHGGTGFGVRTMLQLLVL